MKSDRPPEELEDALLELALERELGGRKPVNLAPAVAEALGRPPSDDERKNMEAIAHAGISDTPPLSSRHDASRRWAWVANAACIVFFVYLAATLWPDGESGSGAAPVTDDHTASQERDDISGFDMPPPLPEVKGIDDISGLPEAIDGVRLTGKGVDDACVDSVLTRCPNLRVLELQSTWVTGDSLKTLARMKSLRVFRAENNDYIRKDGWDGILEVTWLQELVLSRFVGQRASLSWGGESEVEHPPEFGPPLSSDQMNALSRFSSLRKLSLFGNPVNRADLDRLTSAIGGNLRHLDLSYSDIEAQDLAYLARCDRLERLVIISGKLRGKRYLHHLARVPVLRHLEIGCTGMSFERFEDDHLEELAGISGLRVLRVHSTILDSGQCEILSGLRGLRRLQIDYCKGIVDRDCATFAGMRSLDRLDLLHCRDLGDAGLQALVESDIRYLGLSGSTAKMSGEALKSAARSRPDRRIRIFRDKDAEKKLADVIIDDKHPSWLVLGPVKSEKK